MKLYSLKFYALKLLTWRCSFGPSLYKTAPVLSSVIIIYRHNIEKMDFDCSETINVGSREQTRYSFQEVKQ